MNKYDEDWSERKLLTPDIISTGVGCENHEISISDSDEVPQNLIIEEPIDEHQLTSEEDDCCVQNVTILIDKYDRSADVRIDKYDSADVRVDKYNLPLDGTSLTAITGVD